MQIPLRKATVNIPSINPGRGLVPNFRISLSFQEKLTQNDVVMKFALELDHKIKFGLGFKCELRTSLSCFLYMAVLCSH